MERQAEKLEQLLSQLPPAGIADFDRILMTLRDEAYTWDLWGVAYIIAQGCSDDYFSDFRNWLISMGRDAFEKAVTDPESVESLKSRADVEDIFFAEFLTVPDQAYQAKTGKALPVSPKGKAVPSGKEWKTEDDLKHRFSRLFAKYFGSA